MTDIIRSAKALEENQEWISSIKDRIKVFLVERRIQVLEGGPNSPAVRVIDAELTKMITFCDENGVHFPNREAFEQVLKETERDYEEKVDSIRQAYKARYWLKLEEQVAEEELFVAAELWPVLREKARLKKRKEATLERAEEENLKVLHLLDEDPENCEIVYQGPVFRLINPSIYAVKSQEMEDHHEADDDDLDLAFVDDISKSHQEAGKRKYSYNPFLLPTYFFGKHRACFHEQQEMPTDFMAGLRFDPDNRFTVKAIDSKVTICRAGQDAFGPFMHSSYQMEEGDVVRLGQFHLVVERNHGYSMGALYQEAKSHLKEMMEIIFDTDKTTEAQDLEAYHNMSRVLNCNLPAEKKQQLKDYVARTYLVNFEKLWVDVSNWEAKMPMPDARKFEPLLMTLKQLDLGKQAFPFATAVSIADLRVEALKRMQVYLPMESLNETEYAIWNVEMARFVEMGLLQFEDFGIKSDCERAVNLQSTLSVRKLIDALYLDEQNQLEGIIQLLQTARGLVLYDIYGADEIVIRNQDVDLKLSPKLLVVRERLGEDSYVAQIARKIAKNAWVKLHQKRTVEDRRNELDLIQALIDLGKVKPIHLVDFGETDDPLAQEKVIEAKLKELEEGIAGSLRREELEKQEKAKVRLLAESAFEKEYSTRAKIIERSLDLVVKLHAVGDKVDPETLYGLLKDADLFTDSAVSQVVEGSLEELIEETPVSRELADYEGRMTKVALQVAPFKKSWTEVGAEWREVTEKNLKSMIDGAMKGKQSCLLTVLLQKYMDDKEQIEKLFSLDWEKLEKAQETEQYGVLRPMLMNGKQSEDVWPDWLEGEDAHDYDRLVKRIRLDLGERWLKDLLQKIREGKNADLYIDYVNNLLATVPVLRNSLPADFVDLTCKST